MTTAARPTFEPAKGGRGKGENDLSALSKQYSSRDLPSHTKLKYRESGQSTVDDLKGKDFRQELEEKEHFSRDKREKRSFTETPSNSVESKGIGSRRPATSLTSAPSKKPKSDPPTSLDADDIVEEDEDDDEDSDDDDTAELLRELQKIKKERAEEQARKERERKEEEEQIRKDNLLKGNPLLNQEKASFRVKKRWDDDVVFKNCAKTEQQGQHFINDTIRSEFHRKFMDKYVK